MKSRWFECPACGEEYWTPDATLGPAPTKPTDECWLCGTRDARKFLYSVQAGTPYAPEWWQKIETMLDEGPPPTTAGVLDSDPHRPLINPADTSDGSP